MMDQFPVKNSPSFFENVYDIVRRIPPGRITSYGAIAGYLGLCKSARMVGWALNAAHSAIDGIPAHRVVNRTGALTGKHHFGGSVIMQQLLENEGVEIENDQVKNFRQLFWDPREG